MNIYFVNFCCCTSRSFFSYPSLFCWGDYPIEKVGFSGELGIARKIGLLIWHIGQVFPLPVCRKKSHSCEMCCVFQLCVKERWLGEPRDSIVSSNVLDDSKPHMQSKDSGTGQGGEKRLWYLSCAFFSRNEIIMLLSVMSDSQQSLTVSRKYGQRWTPSYSREV